MDSRPIRQLIALCNQPWPSTQILDVAGQSYTYKAMTL